jgi:hypothetical protein
MAPLVVKIAGHDRAIVCGRSGDFKPGRRWKEEWKERIKTKPIKFQVISVERPLPTAHLDVLRYPTKENNQLRDCTEYLSHFTHSSSDTWHRFLKSKVDGLVCKLQDHWGRLTGEEKERYIEWCDSLYRHAWEYTQKTRFARRARKKAEEAWVEATWDAKIDAIGASIEASIEASREP